MANQMIALGVRGPQIPDLGAAMSRQANMMANMAVARERQGVAQRAAAFRELVGSEGFDPSNPAHIRAASALDPAGAADIAQSYDRRRAAQQTFDVAEMARLRNLGTSVVDEPSYQAWLGEVDKADPRSAAMFRQASPNYNPDFMNRVIMEAEQFINKSIATPTASVQYGEGGGAYGVTVGGLGRPTAEEVTVVQPGMQAPVGGPAPIAAPAPAQPMSATQPGLTAQEAAPILRRAAQSQTISPEDANRVRQSLGPDGQARFEQWMTNNNIVVQQPSGQIITPTTRVRQGAYGGAAPMSAQYSAASSQQPVNQPGTQFRGRDPSMGQYPGSAQVPIERVRREAEAGREPPEEAARRRQLERVAEGETAYTIELEKGRGSADADFLNRYESSAATVRNNIALLNQMLGTARVEGRNVVGSAAPGFSDVVGVGIPGLRFIPGTAAADFDALHQQVMGTAFLDAFENLKGGGPISDREGQAATSARTRLGRNISEREYIKAATELRDAMQSALDRSDRRYERITQQASEERAPAAQTRTTRSGAAVRNWPGN